MDHDHLIVISFRHRKPLTVFIVLMWLKFEEGPVPGDVRNRPQQGLLLFHIVQPDHEEFVMPTRVGELHTAIHPELERRLVIKRDNRHEVIVLGELDPAALRETRLGHQEERNGAQCAANNAGHKSFCMSWPFLVRGGDG